ncbi:MAG: minor capsid protein [Elusimicrobiota bacterium]|jgi:SPP1 gp7 family putative phage head morphogenesis protein|nr:minor capsid protein [Elusimicrobiota bacterium]
MLKKEKKKIVKGKVLSQNAGIKAWYDKELQELIRSMTKDTQKRFLELYRTHKNSQKGYATAIRILNKELSEEWISKFNKTGKELAKKMVLKQTKYLKSSINQAMMPLLPKELEVENRSYLRFGLKGSMLDDPRRAEIIKASINENVSYIKSISEQYHIKMNSAIVRSFQVGGNEKDLINDIMQIGQVTKRKAQLIARDQSSKIYSALCLQEMKDLGIKKFEWVHSHGGEHPRPLHRKLDGHIFEIASPPIIQEQKGKQRQEKGFPGQLINCNCVMRPVIEY